MTEELIQCWKYKSDMTLNEHEENDGDCLYCGAEIDLDDYLAEALTDNRALRAMGDLVVDFWPGTGKYITRGAKSKTGRGVFNMLKLQAKP